MMQPSFNFGAPRSRRSDPASSRRAAGQLQKSGAADSQRQICFELVKQYPGRSSKELAELGTLDRYQVARSLPELEKLNLIRSDEHGKDDLRWYARDI